LIAAAKLNIISLTVKIKY